MLERSLLLLTAAMLVLVLGAVSSDSAEEPPGEPARYVGAAVCGECHGSEPLGRQFQRWTGSMHARSYLALGTGYAEMIDPQARGLADVGHGKAIAEEAERLGRETECSECHAAGSAVDEPLRAPGFHLEDGVQCEICHGPGSVHAAAMKIVMDEGTRQVPPAARLRRIPLDGCMKCHREKPSHAVLEREPFNSEKAWKAIAHPLAKE